MHYNTLIFDAFDTVIHINESKLPFHRTDGKAVPTTAPAVHRAYSQLFHKLDFDVFYAAFSQSYNQVTTQRRADLKEITSQKRFKIIICLLGDASHEDTNEAIQPI